MRWNLVIDPTNRDELKQTVTVEADSWHEALENGLKRHGLGDAALSNLTCKKTEGNGVTVSDALTHRTYSLESYASTPIDDVAAGALEATGLPAHVLFCETDEAPADPEGVFYKERLIEAKDPLTKATASRLIFHYFDALKAAPRLNGEQYFISLQVFDHAFETRPQRPPVAALTWKEWQHEKPAVVFPLSGDEGITFSKIPQAPGEAPNDIENALTSFIDEVSKAPAEVETGVRIESGLVSAFERMQAIYDERDHQGAARLFTAVAMETVDADGAESLLVSQESNDLYIAATNGNLTAERVGIHLSRTRGILGFVVKTGAVLNLSAPESDDRFESDIDAVDTTPLKQMLIAPMQFEGELIGVVRLVNVERDEPFTAENAESLSYLASTFAEFVSVYLPDRQAAVTETEFETPAAKVAAAPTPTPAAQKAAKRRPSASQKKRRRPKK